ncbi:nucleotidyl transferase AbiEii/AbiGii toxin family protein [Dyella sp. M7H15-1]|uniref:nucleotidyl transferase AbiEii/AbiGii toxin family protein n=1 Tax=Dyella sp. M7H15-1 TaxID=2501295 RepID=UPI001004E502|nr:nucleotidyl transferase AbiEii/AbiGii toxin family protein [Dyella sp. M7H15-1]QAU23320.1 nucleotidyl transferase AbiEii/AbiGii toxin family protein [Dyella sp. M7H15-1]
MSELRQPSPLRDNASNLSVISMCRHPSESWDSALAKALNQRGASPRWGLARLSQLERQKEAVKKRLPIWINDTVRPLLEKALQDEGIGATIDIDLQHPEKLQLHYPFLDHNDGAYDYVKKWVILEFGGRSTGEPHHIENVACDMVGIMPDLIFPTAMPQVMNVARTFWEKATVVHVFCKKGSFRGDRFARHWHDLVALANSEHFETIITNRDVAQAVATHKSYFFREKDANGQFVDYEATVCGQLQLVPTGDARKAIEADYRDTQLMMDGTSLEFDQLMDTCQKIQDRANQEMAA